MGTPGLEGGIRKRAVLYLAGCLPYFFGTLKEECLESTLYGSHDEVRLSIFTYLEVYYNRIRRHSTLGYVSPLITSRGNVFHLLCSHQ